MSPIPTDTYYILPSSSQLSLDSYTTCNCNCNWIQPILIEDEDLMFGGKTLSAWYEEDRSRLSGSSDDGHQSHGEEQPRGRARERLSASKKTKTQRK